MVEDLKRHVLVLGAGASKALSSSFGLGQELLYDIHTRVDGNLMMPIWNELKIPSSTVNMFKLHLGYYIFSCKNGSIDHFISEIEDFPEFKNDKEDLVRIAKYCIVFHILGYEGALLRDYPKMDISEIENTWFFSLYLKIKTLLDEKKLDKLLLLTFNYDRVLEYFLVSFFPDYPEIKEFIKTRIIHVYGEIDSIDNVKFGAGNDKLENLVIDNIKTIYSERLNDTILDENGELSTRDKCRLELGTFPEPKAISLKSHEKKMANMNIGFIGFSFDELNCRFLNLSNDNRYNPKFKVNIYANKYDAMFELRRAETLKCRKVRTDFNFSYCSAEEFLNEFLQN